MRNTHSIALLLFLVTHLINGQNDKTCLRCYGEQCEQTCTGHYCYLVVKTIHGTSTEDYGCIDSSAAPADIGSRLGSCSEAEVDDHRDAATDRIRHKSCYCNTDRCNAQWTPKEKEGCSGAGSISASVSVFAIVLIKWLFHTLRQ